MVDLFKGAFPRVGAAGAWGGGLSAPAGAGAERSHRFGDAGPSSSAKGPRDVAGALRQRRRDQRAAG
ncbi:hypothetical protein DK427_01105 [Methylobacterium radiodurans]|uniref:Uncharacterized protein n=1 Tax=Methylobacterium radiodurans TaxID=2202828 RepID=A0A2U8VM55_9HYPH|nr:hypothetical protein DK427_01105 [Methylobacterium radiodurans]